MIRKLLGMVGVVLALAPALPLAAACDPNGSASSGGGTTPTAATSSPSATPTTAPTATPTATPTAKPTPTPAKKPFFPTLAAVGGQSFAQVIGAPVGSVCSVKARLKPSGTDISGTGLKPRQVTDPSQGASWNSDKDQLFKPNTAPGQKAYWEFTCTNTAYNPSSVMKISDFDFLTP